MYMLYVFSFLRGFDKQGLIFKKLYQLMIFHDLALIAFSKFCMFTLFSARLVSSFPLPVSHYNNSHHFTLFHKHRQSFTLYIFRANNPRRKFIIKALKRLLCYLEQESWVHLNQAVVRTSDIKTILKSLRNYKTMCINIQEGLKVQSKIISFYFFPFSTSSPRGNQKCFPAFLFLPDFQSFQLIHI